MRCDESVKNESKTKTKTKKDREEGNQNAIPGDILYSVPPLDR